MIDLYTFTSPNGRKVSIALEELELPYTARFVDITQGEQFKPEFSTWRRRRASCCRRTCASAPRRCSG